MLIFGSKTYAYMGCQFSYASIASRMQQKKKKNGSLFYHFLIIRVEKIAIYTHKKYNKK